MGEDWYPEVILTDDEKALMNAINVTGTHQA